MRTIHYIYAIIIAIIIVMIVAATIGFVKYDNKPPVAPTHIKISLTDLNDTIIQVRVTDSTEKELWCSAFNSRFNVDSACEEIAYRVLSPYYVDIEMNYDEQSYTVKVIYDPDLDTPLDGIGKVWSVIEVDSSNQLWINSLYKVFSEQRFSDIEKATRLLPQ